MLELIDVWFGYNADDPILRGVMLHVQRGESLALMGPSGSGKSTTLGLIGNMLQPDSGRIELPFDRTARGSTSVAWVFQGGNLLGGRTAIDNVVLPALARGLPRGLAEIEGLALLERVGLFDRASDVVEELSGGQSQRVSIARAMMGAPNIVLADEPSGQLDSATTEAVIEALLDATSESILIISTHDERVAVRCDRIVRFDSGTLIE